MTTRAEIGGSIACHNSAFEIHHWLADWAGDGMDVAAARKFTSAAPMK
jgi:hypothetical protein